MGIHKLTIFTMAQTWGKPSPSPYNILCDIPQGLHPNGVFSWDSQIGNPLILEIGTPVTFDAHNFLCRTLVQVRFQEIF